MPSERRRFTLGDVDSQPVGWAEELVGVVLGRRYRLARLLGAGGMGAVFAAENVALGRRIAIKVLLPELLRRPEAVRRFAREARAAAQVAGHGVAEIFDLDEDPRVGPFIVMEYLVGESLFDRIDRAGPMTPDGAVALASHLLLTLARVHEHGVVHRDLKPENVFMARTPGGEVVKILDFGVVRMLDAQNTVALTRPGGVLGTPAYMAPEQLRGSSDVDQRADLYSVAAIVFQCLTGSTPHPGDDFSELIRNVLDGKVYDLGRLRPELPGALVAAVHQGLSVDPAARFADADAMRRAFVASAGGSKDTLEAIAIDPSLDLSATFQDHPADRLRNLTDEDVTPVDSAALPGADAPLSRTLDAPTDPEGAVTDPSTELPPTSDHEVDGREELRATREIDRSELPAHVPETSRPLALFAVLGLGVALAASAGVALVLAFLWPSSGTTPEQSPERPTSTAPSPSGSTVDSIPPHLPPPWEVGALPGLALRPGPDFDTAAGLVEQLEQARMLVDGGYEERALEILDAVDAQILAQSIPRESQAAVVAMHASFLHGDLITARIGRVQASDSDPQASAARWTQLMGQAIPLYGRGANLAGSQYRSCSEVKSAATHMLLQQALEGLADLHEGDDWAGTLLSQCPLRRQVARAALLQATLQNGTCAPEAERLLTQLAQTTHE